MKTIAFLIFGSLVIVVNFFLGGLAVEYLVEFWVPYIKGVPVDVPFLPCGVAGIFLAECAIPLAILTWVLSFAI